MVQEATHCLFVQNKVFLSYYFTTQLSLSIYFMLFECITYKTVLWWSLFSDISDKDQTFISCLDAFICTFRFLRNKKSPHLPSRTTLSVQFNPGTQSVRCPSVSVCGFILSSVFWQNYFTLNVSRHIIWKSTRPSNVLFWSK